MILCWIALLKKVIDQNLKEVHDDVYVDPCLFVSVDRIGHLINIIQEANGSMGTSESHGQTRNCNWSNVAPASRLCSP